MDSSTFSTWLKTWLARHPLNQPRDLNQAQYTAEVMAKLRALEQPAATPATRQRWSIWSRPTLAWATAAAGLLLVIGVVSRTADRPARLASPVGPRLVLAESPSSDDAWLEETMALLEQLDEEIAAESDESLESEEDWLQELQWLDEADLASSS